ncbi:movement protein [cherry latent virus 1]|uniref:Movement protein n=1 Tax=cherry latent virus 1 TaxID=3050482 RepID=A0AAE7BP04_9VIRU|nr:movement protein [Cherry symptomless virus]QIA61762.1 movement protein [cherry latent virus 1]
MTMVRGHKSLIAEGDMPIAGVKSSRVYSDITPFTKSSNLMIHWNEFVFKVMPEDIADKGFRLMSIPVIPISEIEAVKKTRGAANYVHWGALSISIDALFKKNAGVTGRCYVFDTRWVDHEQSLLQKFHFNLDSGSATVITSPNFPVSLDDPDLASSISVVVVFENLNFKKDSYPISVRVGNMCRFFDSFLSAVKNKDESNFRLESTNATPLGIEEFGFEDESAIQELFSYVKAVPTQAVQSREFELPRGMFGLLGKKKVKRFEFSSRSGQRRQSRTALPTRPFRAVYSEDSDAEVKSTVGEGETSKIKRANSVSSLSSGSNCNHFKDLDSETRRFEDFILSNKLKQREEGRGDGSYLEPEEQSGCSTQSIPRRGEQTSPWKDRGNSGTDTSVNLRKHRNPRNLRANGVSERKRGGKERGGDGYPDIQSEGCGGHDQDVQDNLYGWEHQFNDLQTGL